MLYSFKHKDIEVTKNSKTLIIKNSNISRSFDLSGNSIKTVSLKDPNGKNFAKPQKQCADFSFIGMTRPGSNPELPFTISDIHAELRAASILDAESVIVKVAINEPVSETKYIREYIIYPEMPVIAVQTSIETPVMPNILWTNRIIPYISSGEHAQLKEVSESIADSFMPSWASPALRSVEFFGRSDRTNTMTAEHADSKDGLYLGNLLYCENRKDKSGVLFIQEAPPSSERRDFESYDFRISETGSVNSCGWGIHPAELKPDKRFQGYRHVIAVYHSEEERDMLLKKYLKLRFPLNPEENYSVMVNPWGCGDFPDRVNTKFLDDELKACREIGATHYQIDDGWQAGKTLIELARNNRHMSPAFWEIDKDRFNSSFSHVKESADSAGINLGLWLAPSSNCEYRDWESFAEIVLRYHREYGINIFKIDAVYTRTYEAEENLRKMLEKLRIETNGKIYFNLDTTAGVRPGYFMFLEYGNIFLENRYPSRGTYHPVKTLRNFWNLSRFIRPQTLQIEIPSISNLNEDFYKQKGNEIPKGYPFEYWAAIALFASPLVWMSPSSVPAKVRTTLKNMIRLHLQIREELFAGEIFSAGACPDGKSITGFHSYNPEMDSGYLIFFREAEEKSGKSELKLNYMPEKAELKKLAGGGSIKINKKGTLEISLPESASYTVYSYKKKKS